MKKYGIFCQICFKKGTLGEPSLLDNKTAKNRIQLVII